MWGEKAVTQQKVEDSGGARPLQEQATLEALNNRRNALLARA